jgi:hypothetical protein
VLVEPDAGGRLGQHRGERSLAHVKRLAPQVVAVQFDQVEGVEEDARVVASVADAIEARHAVVAATHRLAVDDAGARAQADEGLDDQREAVGQVVAGTAVEAKASAILARDDAEAVVLDLVQPVLAGGRCLGLCGEARGDEAGREGSRSAFGMICVSLRNYVLISALLRKYVLTAILMRIS